MFSLKTSAQFVAVIWLTLHCVTGISATPSGSVIVDEAEAERLWGDFVLNSFVGNERFWGCYEGKYLRVNAAGNTDFEALLRISTASIGSMGKRCFAYGSSTVEIEKLRRSYSWECQLSNGSERQIYKGLQNHRMLKRLDKEPSHQLFDVFSVVYFSNATRIAGKATHDNLAEIKRTVKSTKRLENGDVEVVAVAKSGMESTIQFGSRSGFMPVQVVLRTPEQVFYSSKASWKEVKEEGGDKLWVPSQLELVGVSFGKNVYYNEFKLTHCLIGEAVKPEWFDVDENQWYETFVDKGKFTGGSSTVDSATLIDIIRATRQEEHDQ
jgi:hypothetical protein